MSLSSGRTSPGACTGPPGGLDSRTDPTPRLDVYNALARAIRGNGSGGIGELNDRLRSVFEQFRLGEVEKGVVGVLPVLRSDVIERYADSPPVMLGPDGTKPANQLPDANPLVLFAN
ncbi:MAG TPA: hypothetical protein VHE14_08475 [Solirubrobacteraceae bacterium]|nr:hypothetical protein [Solirubrobacteraceae bacterium]